ncbi:MAG: VCBS domain-containing protein, partial [Sedimenticola sp.]
MANDGDKKSTQSEGNKATNDLFNSNSAEDQEQEDELEEQTGSESTPEYAQEEIAMSAIQPADSGPSVVSESSHEGTSGIEEREEQTETAKDEVVTLDESDESDEDSERSHTASDAFGEEGFSYTASERTTGKSEEQSSQAEQPDRFEPRVDQQLPVEEEVAGKPGKKGKGGKEKDGDQDLTSEDIEAENRAPVAASDIEAEVGEGDGTISGQLTATDADGSEELSYSVSGDTPVGFELNENGSYSFDPSDEAYSYLSAGDSRVVTVLVTVTDEEGASDTSQIQITVQGTNDAPVAAADVTDFVSEGDGAISGKLGATDVDAGAELSYSVYGTTPAGFELNADGSYRFDPNDDAYSSLNTGDSTVVTVPITVTDDQGATATSQIQITINGTTNTPFATTDVKAEVGEGDSEISGQLGATDVDAGAELSYSVDGTTPAGFELGADGSYRFDPSDDDYSSLGAGDSTVVTVPITVTDEHGETATSQIQITVSGTNDAPIADSDVIASVGEGDSEISGQLSATDIDTGAELSYSIDGDTPAGFELNADGSYSFDP